MLPGTLAAQARPFNAAINRLHPANMGVQFSWLASRSPAAGSLNLATKTGAAMTGTPTLGTLGYLGLVNTFATTTNLTWASIMPSAVQPTGTYWWVGQLNSVAANQDLLQTANGSTGGFLLDVSSIGPALELSNATNSYGSGLNLAINIPYLLIASWTGLTAWFTVKRLDTGVVVQSAAITITAPGASNGTFCMGAESFQNNATAASVAAALFSEQFMPPSLQLRAAIDPWGPWRTSQITPEFLSDGAAAGAPASQVPFQPVYQSGPIMAQ